MAVIFKDVLVEEKTDEEKQYILSILNDENVRAFDCGY